MMPADTAYVAEAKFDWRITNLYEELINFINK
jgi:hypothetical protein